ncbi:unnamed protein product [Cyclocybe aegerita]|uniref:C2H2-type domain-containing protein n=1 Tax=Cyclocybe aegerita TaxID=1973307 RepID=A0A8S0WLG1_CYCAE|nr:unnamed protein product [Cyclocybe aegerita]
MSYFCPASCNRRFKSPANLHAHLARAPQCMWFMEETLDALDEDPTDSLEQEDIPSAPVDPWAEYDPLDDPDLDFSYLEEALDEFHFIPEIQPIGAQGPGPQTAANRAKAARFVLDDLDDKRVTDIDLLAGRIVRKAQPSSQQADKDGDIQMSDPSNVVDKLGLSYRNIRALHKKLDSMPDKAGEWQTKHLRFKDRPDETFTIRHRDPVEAIKSLWKDPELSPEMIFQPCKTYTDDTREDQIFSEMWTGRWWNAVQLYQGVFKHLVSWCQLILPKGELDRRIRCLPPSFGVRHFKNGISALSQISGSERKNMAKILLACLVGSIPSAATKAITALLDFIYIAQYPTHNNSTLEYLQNAIEEFHEHRDYFIQLGLRKDFNIPKFHSLLHYIDTIKDFGTTDNYNTEMFERLHIDFAKHGWQKHHAPSFDHHLRIYLNAKSPDRLSARNLTDTALPFSKVNVYNMFHFAPSSLHDDDDEKDVIKAIGSSSNMPNGRFDTVVVIVSEMAHATGIKGTRVGRLRVIFTLPQKFDTRLGPRELPSYWPTEPLAYVEWHSPQAANASAANGMMYRIKKLEPDTAGHIPGAVVPLSHICQSFALQKHCGTESPQPIAPKATGGVSSTQQTQSFAPTGNARPDAAAHLTTPNTSAPVAESRLTELRRALEGKKLNSGSPYKPEAWRQHLEQAGLTGKYPNIPSDLQRGFDAGIPVIRTTFTPPNKQSVVDFSDKFDENSKAEFERGRYIGPVTKAETEALLGPFQTSPLSLIPKPTQLGKYCIIQNLSHPHKPTSNITSINSAIDSDRFPCTWGTFSVICLLIARLPPGSQAAVRDVKEAYRTIPLKPSQWPGIVVHLRGEDNFAIDTRNCFGLASGAGCYGAIGDTGAQLMRANGIGPLSKWVDDHLFFRIRREHLSAYNDQRSQWAADIWENGGELHDRGRLWFRGQLMPNGKPEEFDEDVSFPIRDLSQASPRSEEERRFTYCMSDIDAICNELGIPWETEKDVPFQSVVPFIGFLWDLDQREVALASAKQEKYLKAIQEWETRKEHNLEETQKLYGKLLHACLVVPAGRAYLTILLKPSMIVLSCHVPHQDILQAIYNGGKRNSNNPRSSGPSQAQSQSSTLQCIQTLTQRSALGLPSETGGAPGICFQIGKARAETLDGQRPLASSSSSLRSATLTATLASIAWSTATTKESSRDGGKDAAETGQATLSSAIFTQSRKRTSSSSTPSMYLAKRIRLMDPLTANTAHPPTFLPPSKSQSTSGHTSQTTTHLFAQLSSVLYGKEEHQWQPQDLMQRQGASSVELQTKARHNVRKNSLPKRKQSDKCNCFVPANRSIQEVDTVHPTRPPAPYQEALTPHFSPQHPHVLARERLMCWKPTTPRNVLDGNGHPTNLTEADLRRILEVMEGAWVEGTREGYGSGLLVYHVFCNQKGISEEQRAPASPILIASFIATITGAYAGGTISNYVFGVRAWHLLHGVSWQMNPSELETLLKAAAKAAPASTKRKKRLPYTKEFMLAIRDKLDLETPLDATVYACLTMTFWSAARLGEFTVKNLTDFKATHHVKPSDVITTTDANSLTTTAFHIPVTKTEPIEGEDVSWSKQNGDTDPAAALDKHLSVNNPPKEGPLFAYRTAKGYNALTKPKFLQTLAKAARAAGLDPLQGHGIRIGSTLEYLLRGIPFEVMKVKGRWASDAFLTYLRKHTQILAPYMQANPLHHDEFIRLTMPPIRCG